MPRTTKDGQALVTIDAAMEQFKIPLSNREFVRRMCTHIGIVGCVVTTGYIRADRENGGKPLNIAEGWSNGFVSEEEARAATSPATSLWLDQARKPFWGVTHPVHGPSRVATRAGTKPLEFTACPTCGMTLPGTGVCDYCD